MREAFALSCALLAGLPSVAFAADAASRAPVAAATDDLCGKRIVLLGELPSHGEARGFQAKAEIARALVEHCGFTAVLFEAPVYEFVGLDAKWRDKSATRVAFDDAIGGFWRAKEISDWRQWLFEAARDGRVLVGGIDDQVSATSGHARAVLPALVAKGVAGADAGRCKATVARNLSWSYDEAQHFDEPEQQRLLRCARSASAPPGSTDAVLLANFASSVAREVEAPDAPARDAAMHANVEWYLRRWPPGTKAIVWTATVHAALRAGDLREKPLGAWLRDAHGDEVGSIGFSALAGRGSMAGHPAKELPALGPHSLEERALAPALPEAYLDAKALRELGSAESRLFGKPLGTDWSRRFDAVIVFREELPATFEERAGEKPRTDQLVACGARMRVRRL